MSSIYVIDDDIDLLATVKSLLYKRGFDVTTFFDWEIASRALKFFSPNIILMDVFMGATDGLDACRKLKASPYTKHIPVMLFSGFPKVADSAINDYGADDFIAKPFELGDLVKKLYTILSKKGHAGKTFLNRFLSNGISQKLIAG